MWSPSRGGGQIGRIGHLVAHKGGGADAAGNDVKMIHTLPEVGVPHALWIPTIEGWGNWGCGVVPVLRICCILRVIDD